MKESGTARIERWIETERMAAHNRRRDDGCLCSLRMGD